jgi:hypothetical protein
MRRGFSVNYKEEYKRIKKNINNYSKEEFDEILMKCDIERYQKEEEKENKKKKERSSYENF